MTAEEYFERGKYHYKQGKWDEAIEDYTQAIQREPERFHSIFSSLSGNDNLEELIPKISQSCFCPPTQVSKG